MPLKAIILGLRFAKTSVRADLLFIGICWISVCFKKLPIIHCSRLLGKQLQLYRISSLLMASDFCSNNPVQNELRTRVTVKCD